MPSSRKNSCNETHVPASIPEDKAVSDDSSRTSSGSDGEDGTFLEHPRGSVGQGRSSISSFSNPQRKISTGSRKMSTRRKLSVPLAERINRQHSQDIDETLHDVSLQHTQVASVEKKDFAQEVRGTRDINNFLQKSEVFLDLAEIEISHIVDKMLGMMMKDPKETVTNQELKSLIFTDDTYTQLTDNIQGTISKGGKYYDWEQTWLCSAVTIPTLRKRHVGIARLKHRCNLGQKAEEVRFFILILCPSEVKKTKSALETGRTFATLFSDMGLRHELLTAPTVEEFKESMRKTTEMFAEHQAPPELNGGPGKPDPNDENKDTELKWYQFGYGIKEDLMRRLPYYLDDYKDGIVGPNTIQKTTATTLFLYFSVILPAVALGVLNSSNTHGKISVQQVIVGQTIGAITFTLLAGQPLVVVMTTAPLALFIKIIYTIAEDFDIDFLAFYAMIGIWNTFFLILYSFFNMSVLMKYSSRSTEEIFSNFITIAFITDSTKNMVKTFNKHYWSDSCYPTTTGNDASNPLASAITNITATTAHQVHPHECHPDVCFLSLILMLGTLWLGVTLFDFTKTPFLNKRKREILSDYALPVSVVVFSLVGTVLFSGVQVKTFPYNPTSNVFQVVNFGALTVGSVFGAMGLGFSLSLLFFMDQNISAAMVNSPDNRLQKGNAYHWDLLVVGLINAFLCIFGFPFLHAVLPHSPLHVKCLADTEERVENGYVKDIVVRVRETRLTNLFSNILIGISMLFLGSVLTFIPTPVLDGLFLYLAITALYGNQMFERIMLLFMEQAAYPPNHYIRQVPQRKIHTFTLCQCGQLLVLCAFGFAPWPYAKMIFPLVILFFLPVRHMIIPLLVEKKYLSVLDGH
ncbi:solute carrier family 4 member 11-like isoform X1 [Tigriopus californicus]|uniref:solute carrier family 4 member 11-like isoform X1 n=2 Tax=Tigriopus californicus TaxID=6832 RepID=UPI0027D9D11B|nr:solute carrier family 4 member 11-like isoform X1 [Tigriopus californicus]